MLSSIRHASHLTCALFGMAACGLARADAATGAAPSPSVASILASLPKWSATVSLDSSFGYKDNLLLSYTDEERSSFARAGVEMVLLRLPTGPVDYSLYAEADGTHFFSGRAIDHEAQAWVISDFGYRLGEPLRLSLPVTGYYVDRVQDVSDTDVERIVARMKETGGMLGPTLRWKFHPSWWIEGQAMGQRRTFDEADFNSNVGEGTVRLAWLPADRVEVRVSGTERWRDFANRSQYSRNGREIVGAHLKIAEREAELRFSIKWDEEENWRTVTRASGLHYRDNGSGYFSYDEKKVAQDIEWKNDAWTVRAGGIARRIDYLVQTVGFGTSPPPRLRDEFSAELRVERKLSSRWKLFANYTWERTRSNDRFASYVMNEGLLGVRWSWDK